MKKRVLRMISSVLAVMLASGMTACRSNIIDDEITSAETQSAAELYGWDKPGYVIYDPLPVNEYSRCGDTLHEVNGIVVHYVANPSTTAEQNRSYFSNLAETGETSSSSHFIIGLDGEVLQLMPTTEIAYCSNSRNADTLSIECCHPDEDGRFTGETYASLVMLCRDLCLSFGLSPKTQIIRHYDITGKLCPRYFVENEDSWETFLSDVTAAITSADQPRGS